MKLILAAFAFFLAAPATAFAEATLTMREVPLHGERSLAAAAPARFDLVGLHWRGSGRVEFRTRSISGRWREATITQRKFDATSIPARFFCP